MITIDLSKQQALDAHPGADQQNNFTANIDIAGNLRKAFANNSSTNINLSKTQLSKMIQSGGFLGRRLGPLIKISLIKNIIKPLTKSALIPLGLTAAASAADAGIIRFWNSNTSNIK